MLICKVLRPGVSFISNIKGTLFLFRVMCLLGLFWQLLELSGAYFKYNVNRHTTVFIPQKVEDLSMVICLPIAYVIDYNKFNTEFQYNWTPDKFNRQGMLLNLSIHQINSFTYDADHILDDVLYWDDVWGGGPESNNFSSIMEMQKYFFGSNICYVYSVRSFKPLNVQWIRGGSIVYLYFGKQISETQRLRLFIAESDIIPFRETIEARNIFRGNSSMKPDYFKSSHYRIRRQLLPPPYETACYSYSQRNFTNNIECIEHCLVAKSFKKWKEIPTRSLVPNNTIDYKFVNVRNRTKYIAELEEIRLSCQLSCPNTSCDDTQLVTIQETGAYLGWNTLAGNNISISWHRQTPSIPSVSISCRPTSTLTELILYMMSSVSTWTGLSMMSINPFLFLRRLLKTKSAPSISTVDLCRHRKLIAMKHMDRVSRLEDCVVSQSLAHDKLRQLTFQLLNDYSKRVR